MSSNEAELPDSVRRRYGLGDDGSGSGGDDGSGGGVPDDLGEERRERGRDAARGSGGGGGSGGGVPDDLGEERRERGRDATRGSGGGGGSGGGVPDDLGEERRERGRDAARGSGAGAGDAGTGIDDTGQRRDVPDAVTRRYGEDLSGDRDRGGRDPVPGGRRVGPGVAVSPTGEQDPSDVDPTGVEDDPSRQPGVQEAAQDVEAETLRQTPWLDDPTQVRVVEREATAEEAAQLEGVAAGDTIFAPELTEWGEGVQPATSLEDLQEQTETEIDEGDIVQRGDGVTLSEEAQLEEIEERGAAALGVPTSAVTASPTAAPSPDSPWRGETGDGTGLVIDQDYLDALAAGPRSSVPEELRPLVQAYGAGADRSAVVESDGAALEAAEVTGDGPQGQTTAAADTGEGLSEAQVRELRHRRYPEASADILASLEDDTGADLDPEDVALEVDADSGQISGTLSPSGESDVAAAEAPLGGVPVAGDVFEWGARQRVGYQQTVSPASEWYQDVTPGPEDVGNLLAVGAPVAAAEPTPVGEITVGGAAVGATALAGSAVAFDAVTGSTPSARQTTQATLNEPAGVEGPARTGSPGQPATQQRAGEISVPAESGEPFPVGQPVPEESGEPLPADEPVPEDASEPLPPDTPEEAAPTDPGEPFPGDAPAPERPNEPFPDDVGAPTGIGTGVPGRGIMASFGGLQRGLIRQEAVEEEEEPVISEDDILDDPFADQPARRVDERGIPSGPAPDVIEEGRGRIVEGQRVRVWPGEETGAAEAAWLASIQGEAAADSLLGAGDATMAGVRPDTGVLTGAMSRQEQAQEPAVAQEPMSAADQTQDQAQEQAPRQAQGPAQQQAQGQAQQQAAQLAQAPRLARPAEFGTPAEPATPQESLFEYPVGYGQGVGDPSVPRDLPDLDEADSPDELGIEFETGDEIFESGIASADELLDDLQG